MSPVAGIVPAFAGGALAFIAISPAQAAETSFASGLAPVAVNWDKGVPELSSLDGQITFRPKGRIILDAGNTSGSSHPERNIEGDEVRTLRLGFDGKMGGHLAYSFESDFVDHKVAVKGAYVVWRDHWRAHDVEFTFGNRLSERSLEGSSSSDGTPFMERNAVASAITPLKGFYGLGVIGKVYGRDWHVATQVAGDDLGNRGVARDTLTYLARGHWNPIKTSAATMHVAAWSYYEDFPADQASVSRNSSWGGHFNDRLQVPLGTLRAPLDGAGYGLELGGVAGSSWTFLEVGRREIQTRTDHVDVDALALSAGWMITGEAPSYSSRGGTLGKVRPQAPLSKGGAGAFEVAMRYQFLDNTDAPNGAKGREATVGVNWRLEEWMRLMVNVSHWDIEHKVGKFAGKDAGDSLAGRLQVSF